MKAAFLISERALRLRLAKHLEPHYGEIEEYPTAAKALTRLVVRHYDLIVMHWKVYPGFGSGDSRIDELAGLIPNMKLNSNAFYWEVGLRVLDLIRADDSANCSTPVIVVFPDLAQSSFGMGDQLSRDSVESDLSTRQPAEALFGVSAVESSEFLARNLPQ